MTAKELIIDFLYLAFLILLIGGAIIFSIQGDRVSAFANFLKSAWPIIFLLASLGFKLHLTNSEKTRADSTGMTMSTLNLSYGDKMMGELIAFGSALAVLLISALSDQGVTMLDIIKALLVLGLVYAWQKYLWLRAR